MAYNFKSNVEELESNTTILVRITDDVLEEKDWGIDILTIQFGVVKSQSSLFKGVYEIPHMVGWTTEEVCEWTSYNEPASHPQNFHELGYMETVPWVGPAF
jgi:hypothetical protein